MIDFLRAIIVIGIIGLIRVLNLGHFAHNFENFGLCLTLEKFTLTSADGHIYRIVTKTFSSKRNVKISAMFLWNRQAILGIIVDL